MLNTILNNVSTEELKKYKLFIYGACWGKFSKKNGSLPVAELIDVVFKNVPKNLQIELINNYRGYNSNDILTQLNVVNYLNVKNNTKDKDHAKLVKIMYEDQVLFYMIGSSNF